MPIATSVATVLLLTTILLLVLVEDAPDIVNVPTQFGRFLAHLQIVDQERLRHRLQVRQHTVDVIGLLRLRKRKKFDY